MKRALLAVILGSGLAIVGCGGPQEATVEESKESMDATMGADTMADTMSTGTDDAAAPATTE